MALHLIKLAVGATSVDDVRTWQATRAKASPPLRHRTRNFPRRAAEILDGGSIYWVVARMVAVRQQIEDIVEAQQPDGTRCTDIVLNPVLVPVCARLMKPFQGWRYLAAADAPEDETTPGFARGAGSQNELPPALRRELAALALI